MRGAKTSFRSLMVRVAVLALFLASTVASVPGVATAQSDNQPDPTQGGVFGPQQTSTSQLPQSTVEQPGFVEDVVWTRNAGQGSLVRPVAVRFASDGRAFVAEKSGIIKAFDSVDDPTPTITADLRSNVHDYWDRGFLGFTIDPNFPASPYLYALYAFDPGNSWNDGCPDPPGATNDGCVINGRLSRIQVDPATNVQVGPEQVLIEGLWCQQYPSHSVGDLLFDSDGALLASAGDGASFGFADYGQGGGDPGSPTPANACGDPDPTPGAGGVMTAPDAEGGALRSQDPATMSDPISLDGSVIRVDPATGDAFPGNPLIGGNPEDDRIVAYGLRNPFRMTSRPGSNEIWVGDVGWNLWEEINVIADPTDSVVENFGWPCWEGVGHMSAYDSLNLDLCEGLYTGSIPADITSPFDAQAHGTSSDPTECPGSGASTSGLAFYQPAHYPAAYDGALFYADYSWKCVWVMFPDASGDPDPGNTAVFLSNVGPVNLQIGPGGDLFVTDFDAEEIIRITYPAGNGGPTAVIGADQTTGVAPLDVQFDGSGSFDPEGDFLRYDWDLNGDGVFGDSTEAAPSFTYDNPGNYLVQLEVTDDFGATDLDTLPIDVTASSDTPPTATITSPVSSTTWQVGDVIPFAGFGDDLEDGLLPASALEWQLNLHHCDTPTDCHVHVVETRTGVDSGSFTAPDHEYPSYLTVVLTATDSDGRTGQDSVDLQPETVDLTFESSPAGLDLAVGTDLLAAPFVETVIIGSVNSISAVSPQSSGGSIYTFDSWSDGGAMSHDITAPASPATYTANFVETPGVTGPGLVSGVVSASTDGWLLVDLGGLYVDPVVVATPAYTSASPPVVTRVRVVGPSSFEVKLDRTQGVGSVSAEVYWVAAEAGVYSVASDGVKMEAGTYVSSLTDNTASWVGQPHGYVNSYASPVVLGQVMSENDPLWSVFWARGTRATYAPDDQLWLGKHVGEDPVTARADEVVGYIVIEAGSGSVGGVDYEAGVGTDTVGGVGNTPPYTYPLGSAASVVVLSAAGMDGNHGGWPILYGLDPLGSGTGFDLAFDEDQAGDVERIHTTEQVAYLAITN